MKFEVGDLVQMHSNIADWHTEHGGFPSAIYNPGVVINVSEGEVRAAGTSFQHTEVVEVRHTDGSVFDWLPTDLEIISKGHK
jgi:hypothetical protein